MTFFFGAHMPCANIIGALSEIQELGGNFIQIFVDNPRGTFNPNLITKYNKIGDKIKEYLSDNIMSMVIHAPYTLNFAKDIDHKSIQFKTICNELIVADKIGAIGCVIHVGKSLKLTDKKALSNMLLSLRYIVKFIKDNNLKFKLILETAAGQGTEMFVTENNSIEYLSNFYHMFNEEEKKHLKICIDTCHIFSAGIDISTRKKVKYFFRTVDLILGTENVALIHFNDSQTPYNSHVDRHASIGEGTIGISALSEVLKQAYKRNIPCVLETRGDSYVREIPWLKELTDTF